MPLLTLSVVQEPDRVVVRLSGEADLSTWSELATGLGRAAAGHGPVVLDAAELRFCDCSALRAVSSFAADLAVAGRHCRLVGASSHIRRLIQLVGLEQLIADGQEAPTAGPWTAG